MPKTQGNIFKKLKHKKIKKSQIQKSEIMVGWAGLAGWPGWVAAWLVGWLAG